jgi:ADP-L-glycero-D-manno-heptose 6-epimerase
MIAITGAAGFIGSNLAHRLADKGHRLWQVDRPNAASRSINWLGLKNFTFSTAERFLLELDGAQRPPIKAVFHLGACSSTRETDWTFLYQNNVEYSHRL